MIRLFMQDPWRYRRHICRTSYLFKRRPCDLRFAGRSLQIPQLGHPTKDQADTKYFY